MNLKEFLTHHGKQYVERNNKIISYNDNLFLECQNIKTLPDDIGNLSCTTLILYENNITSLPKSFNQLTCKEINLSGNLNIDLSNIKNIKTDTIFLDNINLKEIPQTFETITCKSIYLRKNPLVSGLRYLINWDDNTELVIDNNSLLHKPNSFRIKDYRQEINLEYELFNNPSLSGAKDCYDSGLFSFNTK